MLTNRCNMIMLSRRDKKAITGDWSREKKLILFPDNLPWETLRLGGNKINCFPRDQSLSDLLYSPRRKKHFRVQISENKSRERSAFAGNSELLPSDVIGFSMLPAQRFWRETVSFVRCHVTSK